MKGKGVIAIDHSWWCNRWGRSFGDVMGLHTSCLPIAIFLDVPGYITASQTYNSSNFNNNKVSCIRSSSAAKRMHK